jgi:hypothetical protein
MSECLSSTEEVLGQQSKLAQRLQAHPQFKLLLFVVEVIRVPCKE